MNDDFNKYLDLWDKAVQNGVFSDAPKPPVTTPQTSDPASFFGPINSKHVSDVRDCDTQYWNDVYELSVGNPEILNESESVKSVLKQSADAIMRSPNPIRPGTVGKDQDLSPGSLGLTFSEKDIEELAGLKLKLHELKVKLSTSEGHGKVAKNLESQIDSLSKQIDEFSDELTHSIGDKKSCQGIEIGPNKD